MNPTKVKTIALGPVDLPEGPLLQPGKAALVDGDDPHIRAALAAGRLLTLPADADVDLESLPTDAATELAATEQAYAKRLKSDLAAEATQRGLSDVDGAPKPQLVAALEQHDHLLATGADITETSVPALAELPDTTPTTEEPQP